MNIRRFLKKGYGFGRFATTPGVKGLAQRVWRSPNVKAMLSGGAAAMGLDAIMAGGTLTASDIMARRHVKKLRQEMLGQNADLSRRIRNMRRAR